MFSHLLVSLVKKSQEKIRFCYHTGRDDSLLRLDQVLLGLLCKSAAWSKVPLYHSSFSQTKNNQLSKPRTVLNSSVKTEGKIHLYM